MLLRLLISVYYLFCLIACSASSSENESRTWTNEDGRTMEAKLIEVDLDKGAAVFLKDTGKRYRFPINQLCEDDRKYILAMKDTLSKPAESVTDQRTDFEKSIGKNLVRFSANRMKRVPDADLRANDYYAIYYSAHWCPPCRKFTPQLVSFYNSYSKRHKNFELIFVSSDRSEDDMENYMKSANMPWFALEFGQRGHPATRYAGNGIPCLVLLDNNGKVLANSYSGGRYVGPTPVMNQLKETLDQQ